MRLSTLLLLLPHTLAQFFDQEKCVIDNRSLENMWDSKLLHDLTTCVKSYRPPPQNGSAPLTVKLKFFMLYYTFDSELQEFSALTWTTIIWNDDRLKWDPKKYDGIDSLQTSTARIWAPGVRLMNGINDDINQKYRYISCDLASKGHVNCVFRIVYKVKCNADYRDWPYDSQYCKLEFGAYSEINNKIQFDVGMRAMQVTEYSTEWQIKDYQQIINDSSDKQVTLEFKLERHTNGLAAIAIYPSLILSALTLASLLIDARLNCRMVVICFSLMAHFYLITEFTRVFPENTKDSPNLLMYYRGSLILTNILIIVSFVLNVICKKDVVCYNWVISINDFVFTKFVSCFVSPRWETRVEEGESVIIKSWIDFGNIINTVSIFVSVITYVCLYCVFMPQSNS